LVNEKSWVQHGIVDVRLSRRSATASLPFAGRSFNGPEIAQTGAAVVILRADEDGIAPSGHIRTQKREW
jgi:hypothetical protein